MASPRGLALRAALAELGVPFGLERSCKLQPGSLSSDRFLLSVHRQSLGTDPLGAILQVLAVAGVPDGLEAQLRPTLAQADIVHFGHEAGREGDIVKVYLEYAERARRAMQGHAAEPLVVHQAWKWPAGSAAPPALTRYIWRRTEPSESLMSRVVAACDMAGASHPAARAVAALQGATPGGARLAGAMLLDVEEEGSVRRSFDLNLYPLDLTIAAVRPILAELGRDFAVAADQVDAAFGPLGALALGHVSGGVGSGGVPFATIYFGVEAC